MKIKAEGRTTYLVLNLSIFRFAVNYMVLLHCIKSRFVGETLLNLENIAPWWESIFLS